MKSYKGCWKKWMAVLGFCVMFTLSVIPIYAQNIAATIKGNNVNVRSDATITAQKVSTLTNGDAIIVTGSKKDIVGNVWYAVTFTKDGKEYKGYIVSNYVNCKEAVKEEEKQEVPQQQNAEVDNTTVKTQQKWKGEITGTNVNVRDKAVSGSVVTVVTKGANVTVRKSENGSDGNLWYYISVKVSGVTKKGWIRSDFVKKVQEPSKAETTNNQTTEIDVGDVVKQEQTTTDNKTDTDNKQETKVKRKGTVTGDYVRIRKKAVSGNVICQVNKGTALTIKKDVKGSDGFTWYKVSFKYNGKSKTGYIRSDFVKVKEETKKEDTDKTEQETKEKTQTKATLIANDVRIRKKPVSGDVICKLSSGAEFVVTGKEDGSDKKVWYQVVFTYGGQEKTGYVRSDFVKVEEVSAGTKEESEEENESSVAMSDEEFEVYMQQQGFPESYKDSLRVLHSKHPEWEFRAVQTNLEWSDVLAAESKVGTNLVTKNAVTSWKSTEKAAYDYKTNTWYGFDGGAWVAASKEIISYYLDPRNFLGEQSIFQFESLEYEDYQNKAGVKRLLAGSFMKGKFTEPDGTQKAYASIFVKIGKKVGVSPYHLAARCYQEQGKGTSGSISGTEKGYENLFNYYNIGAYASGGNSAVIQGLKYAGMNIDGPTGYGRPWNTRYKSLLGGSEYVAQKYVKVGQNTLYFQKFNVVNTKNGLYKHQYMTNVQAAESEALKMSKAYAQDDRKLLFYIPVYKNMPEVVCAKPVSNSNPNNYLASLTIDGQDLVPVFNPQTENYDLTVPKKVKKVKISATAVATTTVVEGTGKLKLKRGENIATITCTAENGAVKIYTIHIVRE